MAENREYITYSEEKGSINISNDVIAAVAAAAAVEVEGVSGLVSGAGKDIAQFLGGKKNLGSGVKLNMDGDDLNVDISILLTVGTEINAAAKKIQSSVIDAVEATTGIKVSAVNVHVSGLSLR